MQNSETSENIYSNIRILKNVMSHICHMWPESSSTECLCR